MTTRIDCTLIRKIASLATLFILPLTALTAFAATTPVVKITTAPNPSVQGSSVTINVSAQQQGQTSSGALPPPTGTIAVTATCPTGAASTLGTVPLDATGAGSFTVSTFPCTGLVTLVATYSGDANYSPAASRPLVQTVNAALTLTSLTLSSSSNPSTGGAFTLTGKVTPSTLVNNTYPTGTVSFENISTTPATALGGPATVVTSGTGEAVVNLATSNPLTLPPGQYNLQAIYSGDSNYASSTSQVLVEIVSSPAPSATSTALTASAATITLGQSVTFTAQVTASPARTPVGANGAVTFLDGTTPLGTVNLDVNGQAGLTASSLALGAHSITAAYAGAANYLASTSSAVIVTVQTPPPAATTTALSSSANPATAGIPFQLTATVTPASASGTITFVNNSATPPAPLGPAVTVVSGVASLSVSTLAAGAYSVIADFTSADSTTYQNSSSTPYTQVVNAPATITQTVVTSSANPSVYGQIVTFVVAVSGTSGIPTGSVAFSAGPIQTSLVLDNTGKATFTTGALPVGSSNVIAVYAGDASNQGSSSPTLVQTVNQAGTATSVTSSANPSVYGQAVTLTATVAAAAPGAGTPTGTVTFMEGTTSLGTEILGSGQTTLTTSGLSMGSDSITAVYGGDTNFVASTSSALAQVVNKAPTTTLLSSSANPSTAGQTVTFTAAVTATAPGSGTPTGTVSFTYGGNTATVGLSSSGVASWSTNAIPAGSTQIQANYNGDADYQASLASLTQTVTATPPPPTSADLAISMTVANPNQGDYEYIINVVNNGPGPATRVVLTDALPASLIFKKVVFINKKISCNVPAVGQNTVTCTTASLGPSAGFSVSIVARVTGLKGTKITNTATVRSTTPDPNLANNSASATFTIH